MDNKRRHSIREGGKMGAFCYVNFRISSTAKIKVNLGKLSMWLPVVEPVPVESHHLKTGNSPLANGNRLLLIY